MNLKQSVFSLTQNGATVNNQSFMLNREKISADSQYENITKKIAPMKRKKTAIRYTVIDFSWLDNIIV